MGGAFDKAEREALRRGEEFALIAPPKAQHSHMRAADIIVRIRVILVMRDKYHAGRFRVAKGHLFRCGQVAD